MDNDGKEKPKNVVGECMHCGANIILEYGKTVNTCNCRERSNTHAKVGAEIGQLVDTKSQSYGGGLDNKDAVEACSQYLELLYPNGIPVNKYFDVALQIRCFDKDYRIARGNNLGEDPWEDKAGYCIRAVARSKSMEREMRY